MLIISYIFKKSFLSIFIGDSSKLSMFNLCSFNVESSTIGSIIGVGVSITKVGCSITGGGSISVGVTITGKGSTFAIGSFELFTKVSGSDLVSVFYYKIIYKLFTSISNIKYLSLNLMPLI